jgi:hypothetical protein
MSSRPSSSSTIYPLLPPGSQVLLRIPSYELTLLDRFIVASSSLLIVGSVAWFPALLRWLWRRYKSIPVNQPKRRALYAAGTLLGLSLYAVGPHQRVRVGTWLRVRQWRLWTSWLRFVAMEVVLATRSTSAPVKNSQSTLLSATANSSAESSYATNRPINNDQQEIVAFVPHGIFPFSIAFAILPEVAQHIFGKLRPVVATATQLFPIVRDLIAWAHAM